MSRAERKLKKIQAKEELKRLKEEKEQHKLEKRKQNEQAWENADPATKKVVVAIMSIIGIGIIWAFIAGSNNVQESSNQAAEKVKTEQEKPKATFKSQVINYSYVDPATLRVTVKIKNTSKVEDEPACTINASNSNGTYKGWDIFSLDRTIPAGKEDYMNANVVITNEGAAFVTKVTAECSP